MSKTTIKAFHREGRDTLSDFSATASKRRIAVVSDDNSTRVALQRLLRAAGSNTKAYHCTRDFLASGHIEQTSCLLLDTPVPARDCLELFESQRDIKPLPTIIIGGEARAEPPLRGAAIIYLTRPTEWETLRQAIASALQGV
jgi:FixJ family two-component response regulator